MSNVVRQEVLDIMRHATCDRCQVVSGVKAGFLKALEVVAYEAGLGKIPHLIGAAGGKKLAVRRSRSY